jgi:hypothetical protein
MLPFRGLSVFRVSRKGYPGVYWPGHPIANAAGIVYLHRLVAYEAWGDEVLSKHVHHKDENVDNYAVENLELLTNQEHASHHPGPSSGEKRKCATCGALVVVREARRLTQERVYCDAKCVRHPEKAEWPANEDLVAMTCEMGFEAVGRLYGVTGAAVKKRLRVRGLLTAAKLCK